MTSLQQIVHSWWAGFTLRTKLMAAATLVVSLVVSGMTFWAVNTIQVDARLNDTRFGRDLGLLLAANIAPSVAADNLTEVARFSEQFFHSTTSLRYILYADDTGQIRIGLPFSQPEVQNSLTIERRIQLPPPTAGQDLALVRMHRAPSGIVTDIFVRVMHEGKQLGTLAIGIDPNPTVVASSGLTRDVTIAVFISIWVMVILGAIFNTLQITKPIKELSTGVKNIAKGNFQQRIDLPFGGELGELIYSFNEMAEKLEGYQEQNIDELTAEKAKLETLVSSIADGAILLDSNLHVVVANSTARKFFDWEITPVGGRDILELLPQKVVVELNKPLKKVSSGESDTEELCITLDLPIKRIVRVLMASVIGRIRDTNKDIKGVTITLQDITREVELNEAKSQFISNVSHELRTPLFNIKSFIETLHEYGEDLSAEEQKEFLDTANRETDRLTRLVNDVLDLSRLESAKVYAITPVELNTAIEQTLRTYQLNAKDKKIEIFGDIEPNLPLVMGHYDLLLQVFANLIGNALKFTQSGGRVALRAYTTTPDKTIVRIEIADTGSGIDREDCEAIFERFFRVENRVHTLEGTGLGLSIVRNIITEKHHSQIRVISEVGIGTTFWFDLPAAIPTREENFQLLDLDITPVERVTIGN